MVFQSMFDKPWVAYDNLITIATINKTKVKSVQLGKTLSFVKFVVEVGGVG